MLEALVKTIITMTVTLAFILSLCVVTERFPGIMPVLSIIAVIIWPVTLFLSFYML